MSLELDPQNSWLQWVATAILAAFSGFITLLVSWGRDAHKIYREKVDTLEKAHATFAASCVTREELRDELTRRFEDMDLRRIQMHAHNAELIGGLGDRIGELRDDIKDVHKRIDEKKK